MEEKKCKSCAMMIPKEAKICPHCRKKQQPGACVMLLAIFGALLFIGYIASPSRPPSSTMTRSQPSAPPVDTTPLTEKGKKIKVKFPSWNNDDCNTIGEKKIHIGMSDEQVRAAWGKPYRVNTTTGSFGNHEQWVMHDSLHSDYLYFENGTLTSIQQSQ